MTARRLFVTSILSVPIWVAALAALNIHAEAATTVTWDSNTGTSGAQDGSGTWSVGGATWWTGSADIATTNDIATHIAQFGNSGTLATGATVNVATQSINGLIFATTTTAGYTLTNTAASTLTIGGGGITMNNGAQATTVGDANLSLVLGAAQTWTNNSSSNALNVGGNVTNSTFTLTIAGVGAVNISGNIGGGSGGLTKTGTGTTTLSGTNGYTGTTTVSIGTLQVGNGTSGSIASTSALALGGGTFGGSTFILLGNTTGTTSQTVASLAVNAGASAIIVNANGGSGTTLNVKAISRSVGGTIDFSGSGSTITSTGNTSGILGGYATFGGSTWAVSNGASAITGLSTYASDTWAAGNNTTVTQASNTAYNNVTTYSLRFNANAADTVTLSGTNVITSGGILVTSAVGSGNLSTITGGTLKGASGKDLIAIVNNTGGLSIGSIIADNTTATGLTVSGPGTLTLTAANTFTGATTLNGTLNVSNSLALQNSTVTINNTGSLVFDSSVGSHAFTFAGLTGSGPLSLSDNALNAVALTVGGNNASTTYSGILSGSGSLIKTGTGQLNLTGVNTFTGGITVNGGVLTNGSSGAGNTTDALGTGPITVQSGGTLNFNSSRSLPTLPALTINGAGASGQPGALVGGAGASFESVSFTSITLGSDSTIGAYSGGNGVTFGGQIKLGTFTLTLNPNVSGGSLGLPGVISGTGGLIHNGNGSGTVTTLSGANTYTGATTVTAGTLAANIATVGGASPTSGAFGVNSTTTVSTGATLDLRGFTETLGSISGGGTITSSTAGTPTLTVGGDNSSPTFAGVIQNGSATSVALIKVGTGSQTLSGSNTYTGATTISNGKLVISGVLNGTQNVNVASTGTLASGATGSITTAAAGNVSVSGTLAPGDLGSVGTLTLAPGAGGQLSFASGSTFALDISDATSDQVAFASSGDWLLGSGNVALTISGITAADYGNTYTIFHNVSTSSFTFANVSGYDTADYVAKVTQVGSDYQLTFTNIPEPSAAMSLFGGLGVLLAWRRRQRRA